MTQDVIRTTLRSFPDGLTATEIAKKTGKDAANIYHTIGGMADVYVDRWIRVKRGPHKFTRVYVAVDVPEDAPKPD